MSGRATVMDAAVFAAGGENLLATVRSVECVIEAETEDVRPITRLGATHQVVKKQARIRTTQLSAVSGAQRVSHLDLEGLTLGGIGLAGHVRRLEFEGVFEHEEGSGAGDLWRMPVLVGKDYRARCEVLLPVTGTGRETLLAASGGADDGAAALILTLNGVTVSVPMQIGAVRHVMDAGGVQVLEVELRGFAPATGAYPVSPTGTGSLLAKAFTVPEEPVAVVLTTRADGGVTIEGQFLVEGFGFTVADGAVVETTYEWMSAGPVTVEGTDV